MNLFYPPAAMYSPGTLSRFCLQGRPDQLLLLFSQEDTADQHLFSFRQDEFLLKDTLQAEASDMRLDEVQVFVSVVVLLLQRADGVTLMSDK